MFDRRIKKGGDMLTDFGGRVTRGGGLLGRFPVAAAGEPVWDGTLDGLTSAFAATILSKPEPDYFWDAQVASGADELVVGTDNLTDSGTPTKEVADATLGGTVTTLRGFTTDAMVAASSTVADIGTVTVTGMLIFRFTDAASGTFRSLFSKRDTIAGNNGWEIYVQNRTVSWINDTALGIVTRTIAVDHGTTNAQVIVFTRSVAGNAASIWSREGSATGTCNADTLASSLALTLGAGGPQPPNPGANVAKLLVWIGTDGDGFGETERAAMETALSY